MCLLLCFAVTVLFSDVNVNVVCEKVFSDSDCALVELQTLFLKKTQSVALGSETEITMEVENVNPPCAARERLLIAQMEKYLEKSEQIQVEIRELEHFLLGPEEADISITSFAENGRNGGGYSKFVLLDTRYGEGAGRGVEVADAAFPN